jgi:hypothetical protein
MWNSDGSVVLQAASMQFRVHWSRLSSFPAFISLPQYAGIAQPADQPTVKGCPVVELFEQGTWLRKKCQIEVMANTYI